MNSNREFFIIKATIVVRQFLNDKEVERDYHRDTFAVVYAPTMVEAKVKYENYFREQLKKFYPNHEIRLGFQFDKDIPVIE